MKNNYEPQPVKIVSIKDDAKDVKTFVLKFVDESQQKNFFFFPGQFIMFSIPGFGEAPIGISSSSRSTETFEIGVRNVGSLTAALHTKKPDDIIGIRGPLGKGYFPMKNLKDRNLLLIAGGIGIIPLRAVILDILSEPDSVKKTQLFYGAKNESDLMYEAEYEKWRKKIDVNITVDKHSKPPCDVVCDEGLITQLFETKKIVPNPIVFIVGPPVMCKFVTEALHKANVKDDDIYISLERHMQCGVGECHHCGIGRKLVCEDGPVFPYGKIKDIPNAI